jgi:hypothetical protein
MEIPAGLSGSTFSAFPVRMSLGAFTFTTACRRCAASRERTSARARSSSEARGRRPVREPPPHLGGVRPHEGGRPGHRRTVNDGVVQGEVVALEAPPPGPLPDGVAEDGDEVQLRVPYGRVPSHAPAGPASREMMSSTLRIPWAAEAGAQERADQIPLSHSSCPPGGAPGVARGMKCQFSRSLSPKEKWATARWLGGERGEERCRRIGHLHAGFGGGRAPEHGNQEEPGQGQGGERDAADGAHGNTSW